MNDNNRVYRYDIYANNADDALFQMLHYRPHETVLRVFYVGTDLQKCYGIIRSLIE
jgi:hypothetical protein